MQTYLSHCRLASYPSHGCGYSYPRSHPAPSVDELLQALLPDPFANFPSLDTPYSEYANTNYAASGQDVRAITEITHQRQAQFDDVTADLASVESIMKRVRTVHQQLLSKRDQIAASMAAHHGLISCIRRLPSELLGEIFLRCLPSAPYIEPDATTAPLVLLAVSKRWRRVALGTPRLWCSLAVRPSHRIQQQGLYVYHHWLARARGCPISLAVDTRRPPSNPLWRYEVTELLQPYASRAVRLHITFDEVTAPELLLQEAPMLQHLTLDGDLCTALKKKTMALVQPAPQKLTSLTLNTEGALGADVLTGFNPGWTHLTQLKVSLEFGLEAVDGPTVLNLLTLCPHLQELSFSPVLVSRRGVSPRAVTHTRLRTLDVIVLYGTGCLLDALTLPALTDLQIRDLDIVPGAWRHEELKAFLARSGCPLETLRIHGAQVSVTKADRRAYAALIPTLKHLDLCLSVMMHT